jgi:putative PIN family toxin of toxin-antitoxin system
MRVVLDTNVVVSALLWGGLPYRLLQAAVAGDIELFTSPTLVAELGEVLARPHLAAKLTEQHTSVAELAALYLDFARPVSPLLTPRVVPDDPDDDHVVACASAARAEAIVSGDRHLLRLAQYESTRILTVAQAVQIVGVA